MFWQRLKSDDDVKRQVLAAAAIAGLLGIFEVIFFLRIVVPTVRKGMTKLLYGAVPMSPPDWAMRAMQTVVGVAHEREQALIKRNNAYAIFVGVLIIVLPFALIAYLLMSNPNLRSTGRKHVILDVLMVFGCLAAFQILFFFMGQNYEYTSSAEMTHDMVQRYNETFDHAAERATPPPPLSPEEKLKLTRTAVELAQTHVIPAVSQYLPAQWLSNSQLGATASDVVDSALRMYTNGLVSGGGNGSATPSWTTISNQLLNHQVTSV